MAISHRLRLETPLSLKEIEDLLLESGLGLELLESGGGLDAPGVWVTYSVPDEYTKSVTLEENGFVPDVSVGFRISLGESETEGDRIAEKACAVLLAQGDGDAVYFYNSDNLAFERRRGKLTIYDGWTEWLAPELDQLGIEYRVEGAEPAAAAPE